MAAALAPEPASAVTTELLGSTIGPAARLVAGRQTAAGAVSAAIAALVEGTLRSMSMSTLKIGATALMVAAVIATGAGVSAYQGLEKKPTGSATDSRTRTNEVRKAFVAKPKAEQGADLNAIATLAKNR